MPDKQITYAGITNVTIQAVAKYLSGIDTDTMKERPIEPVDIVIPGYVEAWRWFKVCDLQPASTSDGDYLYNWSGENVADLPPREWNSNGFYCYKPDGIQDHAEYLFGRVAIYGDIVECEYGYRAEKLRILDVWVDKDLETLDPDKFHQLLAITHVKGTFDTFDPRIWDVFGNRGDHQCLTLESHKELSGTSLSGGRTTTLVIDRVGQSQSAAFWNLGRNPTTTMTANRNLYTSGPGSVIQVPQKEWVVKPEGRYCDVCERLIADQDTVVVNWDMASDEDLATLVINHRFHWDVQWRHIGCLTRKSRTSEWYSLGVDYGLVGDSTWATWASNADPFAWPIADKVFQSSPIKYFHTNATIA